MTEKRSSIDLIIEEYKKYVDRTLLEENLKLSYTERVEKLQRLLRTFEELKNAGGRPKDFEAISELEILHEKAEK
ncbi:MAG TPA: hypothetical protein PK683_13725 [Leptospiraceae bacterium]|nr:hypothetical protein [Leptospiraceae bacterium]